MQQKNASLKKLSRAAIVVLLLVLLAAFFLLAGSWAGGTIARLFGWLVGTPTAMLAALANMAPQGVRDVANEISGRLGTFDAARLNLSVVLPYLAVFVALALSKPLALYEKVVESLKQLVDVSKRFITSGESWSDLIFSYLKAGTYVGICTLTSCFLVSSQPPISVPRSNPAYVIADSVQHLLPVQLVVNFDNAELDDDDHLTDQGVTLGTTRNTALKTTMNTLARCGMANNGVTIELYGFASEDPFRDLEPDKSNKLNVQVANRRAKAVYQALVAMSVDGVAVKRPEPWKDFDVMERRRNTMIQVPASTARGAFADRVVVLYLSSSGDCMVVQNAPQ